MKTWAILCAAAMTFNGIGWADPTASATGQPSTPAAPLAPEQLDSLVAPIALYPDELVSQILVACTYPLEVVQASQWLQQHPELKGQDLTTAALLNPDGSPQPHGGALPTLPALAAQMLMLDDLPIVGRLLPSTQQTGRSTRQRTADAID